MSGVKKILRENGKKRRIFYYKIKKKTASRIEPLEKKILDDLIKVIYNIDP